MTRMKWIVLRFPVLALCLAIAGPLCAEELWVPPTHFFPPALNAFPWPTTGTGLASFGFAVPDDFAAFESAAVVLVPKSDVNGTFDVYGSVKREGEAAGAGVLFNLAIPASLPAGTVSEIDLSSLFGAELAPDSAGRDYVSVFFWFPASPALENATVLGLRFVYDPVRVTTAGIENGAVTNAKLADNSVGTAKVANNSLSSEDIMNQSLTGIDIANGSIEAADVDTSQIQARVSGSCPAGESIRAIGSAGAVICEPDTAGMVSFLRTSSDNLCPALSACVFVATCPGGRRAMGGGAEIDENFEFERFDTLDLAESFPVNDTTWRVAVVNNHDSDTEIDVHVVCSSLASGASSSSSAEEVLVTRRVVRPLSRP